MACVGLMPILSAAFMIRELCRRNKVDTLDIPEPTLPVFESPKKKKKDEEEVK